MIDRLKRYGEMAAALTAIAAIFSAMIAAFGGHLPPYISWAEGQTIEQMERQNSTSIAQMNAIIMSDKAADAAAALAKNPSDPNLQRSASYWAMLRDQAQRAALPMRK